MRRLRVVPEHGEGDGPDDGHSLADASLSAARRGVRDSPACRRLKCRWSLPRTTRGTGRILGRWWSIIEEQRRTAAAAESGDPRRTGEGVPNNILLPFRFSTKRIGEVHRAGPYGAFLGSQYDPLWAEWIGTATKGINKTLRDMVWTDPDPYIGIADGSYFVVPSASQLQAEVTLDRLNTRKSLLKQFNDAIPGLAATSSGPIAHQASTVGPVAVANRPSWPKPSISAKSRDETRRLYGSSLFGQSCLAARRLVEAGSKVVSVFWDEFGLAGMGWDTHWNHYQRMKEELAPGLDMGWYGLISDLDRRGLLDDVLVVCTSEHGRTPKSTLLKGAAATTGRGLTLRSSPARGSSGGASSALPIIKAATWPTARSAPKTCSPRCTTCSASTPTPPSTTAAAARCRSWTGKSSRKCCHSRPKRFFGPRLKCCRSQWLARPKNSENSLGR